MVDGEGRSTPFSLAIESGPNAGQRMLVEAAGITVGRQVSNTLVLDDSQLSRHHARFALHDGGLVVTDLDSANGTFVNGARITGTWPLHTGNTVQISATTLRVEASTISLAAANPPPMPRSTPLSPPVSRAASRTNLTLPLLIGAIAGTVLLVCACVSVLLIVRGFTGSGEGDRVASVSTATMSVRGAAPNERPGSAGGSGGAAPPATGGAGVARGDYLCTSFSNIGLVTVG